MTLDELETFACIARCGSFTEASRRLTRSQPAISRRVQQLEAGLGVSLFERRGRRVALSPAGEALLPHAEAALAAVQDGERAARAAESGAGPQRLRVAIVGTLADSHLVDALRAFETRFPDAGVEVSTATSREVSARVRAGDADLGMRYFADTDPGLACTPLGAEKLYLVVSTRHPLRQKRLQRLDKLRGERWLGFPPERGGSDSMGRLLQRVAAEAGAGPDGITVVDSLTAQKRLVEAGMGLALMPKSAIREELRLGSLRAIELRGRSLAQPVVVVQRRRGFESPLQRAFVELLREFTPGLEP